MLNGETRKLRYAKVINVRDADSDRAVRHDHVLPFSYFGHDVQQSERVAVHATLTPTILDMDGNAL